jgi:hypothetical protein
MKHQGQTTSEMTSIVSGRSGEIDVIAALCQQVPMSGVIMEAATLAPPDHAFTFPLGYLRQGRRQLR